METNNINIAAILKDCPKGTKLYSSMCGECEFKTLNGLLAIYVEINHSENINFDQYGRYYDDGECLLFPSKEVRDWGCFQVKYVKGVVGKGEEIKALLEENGGIYDYKDIYVSENLIYFIDRLDNHIKCCINNTGNTAYEYIISTGTELKLEEEKPEFKVGDVVVTDRGILTEGTGVISSSVGNLLKVSFCSSVRHRMEVAKCSYSKVECELATPEEIDRWNKETLEPNHLHYSKDKRKIVHWFRAGDSVVIRNTQTGRWSYNVFSHADKAEDENGDIEKVYCCIGERTDECLPYNENTAKLLGTTDDYKEE